MAKEKTLSGVETLYSLVAQVGCGIIPAKEASDKLRSYVDSLGEEEKKEFIAKAPERSRTIMQVAELFHQLLVVMGAGQ